jgi:CRISPR-associated exonuclease Cas4
MIGGVGSPTLAQARELEANEEDLQRERLWYVACTRARDLLVIPDLPSAGADTWIRAVDLQQSVLHEWSAEAYERDVDVAPTPQVENEQTSEQFLDEADLVKSSSPPIYWRIPSDHDADRPIEAVVVSAHVDASFEAIETIGSGSIRGLVLHKLFEELLNAELEANALSCQERAQVLLRQLIGNARGESVLPDSAEIARTCLKALAHPALTAIRGRLQPEYPVWHSNGTDYLAGRADAVTGDGNSLSTVIDWKSDIAPAEQTRVAYQSQLGDYLRASGATRGLIVYASLGEIEWVSLPAFT